MYSFAQVLSTPSSLSALKQLPSLLPGDGEC